jgi:hypothetical protein
MAVCFDSDRSTHLAEDALGQLWAKFPQNTEMPHVLLKVLILLTRRSRSQTGKSVTISPWASNC